MQRWMQRSWKGLALNILGLFPTTVVFTAMLPAQNKYGAYANGDALQRKQATGS